MSKGKAEPGDLVLVDALGYFQIGIFKNNCVAFDIETEEGLVGAGFIFVTGKSKKNFKDYLVVLEKNFEISELWDKLVDFPMTLQH